jgi:hypothetical protein
MPQCSTRLAANEMKAARVWRDTANPGLLLGLTHPHGAVWGKFGTAGRAEGAVRQDPAADRRTAATVAAVLGMRIESDERRQPDR